MSSTHRTTAATSSDWKTLVQKTVARDAAETNSAVSGTMRSSLTLYAPGCLFGGNVIVLEVFPGAGVIGQVVFLVECRCRELAQCRLDGNQLGLVGLQRLDDLVDDLVLHLGVGEDHVVPRVDVHRLLDADEERVGLCRRQIAFREDLLRGRDAARGDFQRANAPDSDVHLAYLRRAKREEEHVGLPGDE